MAKSTDIVPEYGYSSTVRKVLEIDTFGKLANLESEITFDATTGTVASHKIAMVTGTVAVSIFGVCKDDVTGTGTIEVGTTSNTAAMIAQTTGTDIDENEIWHDASPDASVELTSVLKDNIVTQDIFYTIGTGTLTAGTITFYIRWSPISTDGNVELV